MKYLSNKYPPPIAATCIGRSIKYTVPFNIDDITLYKSFPIGSISLITKFSTFFPKVSNVFPTLSKPVITPSLNETISVSIAFATLIIPSSIFFVSVFTSDTTVFSADTTDFSALVNGYTKLDFNAASKLFILIILLSVDLDDGRGDCHCAVASKSGGGIDGCPNHVNGLYQSNSLKFLLRLINIIILLNILFSNNLI